MENETVGSPGINSTDSTKSTPLATSLSPIEQDLNLQCRSCLESLQRCVNAAEAAAKVDYAFAQATLKLAQNRIHECRLRLAIWLSDCTAGDGTLSAITAEKEPALFDALVIALKIIKEELDTILRSVQEMDKEAEQAIRKSISKSEQSIKHACDNLTFNLYELARLRSSVQMATAIHLEKGPEAALYKAIKEVQDTSRNRGLKNHINSTRKFKVGAQMWPVNSPKLGPISSGFYNNDKLRLETFDIRVLHLHRGSGQDDIMCTLEKKLLPPTVLAPTERQNERSQQPDLDCKTLSYQWGNSRRDLRKIQCNGVGFIVTSNLYSALVHLRSPDSDITLWIDAICINQEDNEEKGNQLQRMGEIYRRSKCTIIWLGDGGFLSRAAFRACCLTARASVDQGGPDSPPLPTLTRSWDPPPIFRPFLILLLLRRSYFTRTWIIQEVALSQSVEVVCGDDKIPWGDFVIGISTVLVPAFGSKGTACMGNILIARAMLPWAARSGRNDPAWAFQTMMQDAVPQNKNILSMAALFRRSHATQPVDKLFGLQGLCEEIQEGSTYGIVPTYNRDDSFHTRRVYIITGRIILSSQNGLQLFSAVNRRSHVNCFHIAREQRVELPTWVPDWSDTGNVATPLSLLLAQNRTFGLDRDEEYHFESHQPSSDEDSPNIWLSGRCLDEISEFGEVCNTEEAQSSVWFSLRFTFTMSECHRLEVLSNWERQFRPRMPGDTFWQNFISTVTCGSKSIYDEGSIMRRLASYRSRSVRNLPSLVQAIFSTLFMLPLGITVWTREGFLERIILYWCFPVMVMSSIWYWVFQLTPNFIFRQGWIGHGMHDGFLKTDFDHMELRRLAMLRSGYLALVPEASCVSDQTWSCKGGVVPLVLRPIGNDFEMVGECYLAPAMVPKAQSLIALLFA